MHHVSRCWEHYLNVWIESFTHQCDKISPRKVSASGLCLHAGGLGLWGSFLLLTLFLSLFTSVNWSWIGFPHTAVCSVLAYSCEIAPFYLYSLHVFAQHKRVMWRHNNKTQWDREEEEEEEQEDPVCKGMSTFWGNTLKLSITIWYWHWYRYINIWIDPGSVGCFRCNGRGGARDNTCREQVRTGSHGLLPW